MNSADEWFSSESRSRLSAVDAFPGMNIAEALSPVDQEFDQGRQQPGYRHDQNIRANNGRSEVAGKNV
ncbi:hypothetical protein [Ensifer sp.]|uniref:hypothetical protein n=1 Tax=Ensifer sp. TaxID=1872086 RepID=UPI0028A10688|nr:hypothetical protein [Ensifer sp.]